MWNPNPVIHMSSIFFIKQEELKILLRSRWSRRGSQRWCHWQGWGRSREEVLCSYAENISLNQPSSNLPDNHPGWSWKYLQCIGDCLKPWWVTGQLQNSCQFENSENLNNHMYDIWIDQYIFLQEVFPLKICPTNFTWRPACSELWVESGASVGASGSAPLLERYLMYIDCATSYSLLTCQEAEGRRGRCRKEEWRSRRQRSDRSSQKPTCPEHPPSLGARNVTLTNYCVDKPQEIL